MENATCVFNDDLSAHEVAKYYDDLNWPEVETMKRYDIRQRMLHAQ